MIFSSIVDTECSLNLIDPNPVETGERIPSPTSDFRALFPTNNIWSAWIFHTFNLYHNLLRNLLDSPIFHFLSPVLPSPPGQCWKLAEKKSRDSSFSNMLGIFNIDLGGREEKNSCFVSRGSNSVLQKVVWKSH